MITKISLSKIACFKKSTLLQTDKRVNLIYGLNGTGKSTISNFFYKQNDSRYSDCSLEGLSGSDILVYNQTFIQEQFYESENLKGIFTLSKKNKDAEIKISNAEKEIKKLQAEIEKKIQEVEKLNNDLSTKQLKAKNKVWEIKTSYTGGDRVLEFCLEGYKSDGLKLLAYLESLKKPSIKPLKTVEEIKVEVNSLAGDNAQKYGKFPAISFQGATIENDDIFKKQIVGNEYSTVGEFINKLGNSDWVKTGFQFLPGDTLSTKEQCPFCQQPTLSQELVDNLKSYFDITYERDIFKLKSLRKEYDEGVIAFPSKSAYEVNPKFESFKKDFDVSHSKLISIFQQNLKLIDNKIKSPSLSISLDTSDRFVSELSAIINKVNKATEEHNKKIDNKETALADLKRIFWDLMRWEYDQTISIYLSDKNVTTKSIIDLNMQIDSLNVSILSQQKVIITQQKETVNIEEAITNINNGLVDLGIDEFKIEKHSEGLYRIARADTSSKIFLSLSEGEKMIISFLYFIESCRGKKSASDAGNKKIVVIDDPISSLSHIYVFNVGRLIHNEFLRTDKYEQIFVLTHSLYFFYELTETKHDKRKKSQKLFRLRKNASGTDIIEMKYEEIQNDYHSYWFIVKDDKQQPSLIANCMRNIIEYFFNFVEKSDLNNVFLKDELQNTKFTSFNRYINRESHSLGQNIFDIKEFNYQDFKDAFQLVFKLNGYEDHYNKMIK